VVDELARRHAAYDKIQDTTKGGKRDSKGASRSKICSFREGVEQGLGSHSGVVNRPSVSADCGRGTGGEYGQEKADRGIEMNRRVEWRD
jgi:hypothetical protein